jgi:hypothetical protein
MKTGRKARGRTGSSKGPPGSPGRSSSLRLVRPWSVLCAGISRIFYSHVLTGQRSSGEGHVGTGLGGMGGRSSRSPRSKSGKRPPQVSSSATSAGCSTTIWSSARPTTGTRSRPYWAARPAGTAWSRLPWGPVGVGPSDPVRDGGQPDVPILQADPTNRDGIRDGSAGRPSVGVPIRGHADHATAFNM